MSDQLKKCSQLLEKADNRVSSLPCGCNRGARIQFLNRNASRSPWTQESVQEAKLLYTNHKLSVNTQN